ncbi:sensor histidine kinase [Actinocorallia longicatena]|uniref:histidine kinase n=1 Tax=Actinocorallia longicatena TaxID=111803 RepID=A0ABP6Q6I7_9ACTN
MDTSDRHPAVPWYRRRPAIDAAAVVCAVYTVTGEFGGSGFFGPSLAGLEGYPPLWAGVPLAAGIGSLAWRRRRFPVLLLVGALLVNAIVSAHVAVVLALYTLAERTTSRAGVAVAMLVSAVLVGIPLWLHAGADGAIPIGMAVCFAPSLLGLYVGTRRELVSRIRERTERLERDQHRRIAQARSDERAHIARDMHDVVTHRVSLMVLQATALEAAGGQEAVTIGQQIGATGREALAELRSLVEVLRNDGDVPLAPQPGLAELDALIQESRRIGTPVTLELTGRRDERLPILVEHTAYRFVQEALTNVHKHAPGARTRVLVHRTPRLLRLSVASDRGNTATEVSLPSGGHGLLGLAQRVRLVGGEFTAGPAADGGFELTAEIPTPWSET